MMSLCLPPVRQLEFACCFLQSVVEGKRNNPISLLFEFLKDLFFKLFGYRNFVLSKGITETLTIPQRSVISAIWFLQGIAAGIVALSN